MVLKVDFGYQKVWQQYSEDQKATMKLFWRGSDNFENSSLTSPTKDQEK
jgi:hypothetical protein